MTAESKSKLESLTVALEGAEKRLQHALEAAEVGIWEWDLATNKLYWDKRMFHLFEVTDKEFKGDYSSFRSRVHPEDLAMLENQVNNCIKNGIPFVYWFRIKSKIKPDGWKYIKGKGRVIRDASNKPIIMTGVNLESDCPTEFLNFINKSPKLPNKTK